MALVLRMMDFVKWNLISCIEEVFGNSYQEYDGFVFLGNTAWICQ